MTRRCYYYRSQTNPWHRVEVTKNPNTVISKILARNRENKTLTRISEFTVLTQQQEPPPPHKKQPALSQKDDCKTRKDSKTTALQNKDHTHTKNTKSRSNNNSSTTLESAVVKTQKFSRSCGGFLIWAAT